MNKDSGRIRAQQAQPDVQSRREIRYSSGMALDQSTAAAGKVRFAEEKAGDFALGFITLDHARALNALDLSMLAAIGE
jgi:hypothetical protein